VSTPQSTPLDSPDRMTGRAWGVLLVLSGAIFLEEIDVSMTGVALPSIRADLGLSTAGLQWVVSAYVLGYGGFVLLGGRAADLLGRRRMFLTWLVVFIAFSGLGGFATEGWVLILTRFVTGVAAGFMTPAGLSIVTTTYAEGRQRNKALLVYAGAGAGGFAIGLVVGGLLTGIDWRWVFFAPVLMATVILVVAIRLIPREDRPERRSGGFDLIGAATLTAAMLILVFAIVQAPEVALGWTIGVFAVGVALLVAFVAIERRSPAPLIRLGILRSAALIRANAGAMLLLGAFLGFQFIAVLYLQELRGWSEIETSLALLAIGIEAVLAPTLTPWLVNRFGVHRIAVAGLALMVVGYALFLPVGPNWSYAAMFPSFVLLGVAFALAFGPLTIAATDGIAEEEQGLASGILTMSFQFGGALGLSVVTAVVVAATGSSGSPAAQLEGYRAALIVPLVAAILGVIITASGHRVERMRNFRQLCRHVRSRRYPFFSSAHNPNDRIRAVILENREESEQ
jgi:MFS family permease